MYLIMTISGRPFIELEFDFTGKDSVDARQEHLEDLAYILHTEYQKEIDAVDGTADFYYIADSCMESLGITEFHIKQFDVKIKAKRFLNKQQQYDIKKTAEDCSTE